MSDLTTILLVVATHYGVEPSDLTGRVRTRRICTARHVAMYLARELTGMSFPALGRAFGRDHSSVQHACLKVLFDMDADPELASTVRELQVGIQGGAQVAQSLLWVVTRQRDAAMAEVERLRAVLASVQAAITARSPQPHHGTTAASSPRG